MTESFGDAVVTLIAIATALVAFAAAMRGYLKSRARDRDAAAQLSEAQTAAATAQTELAEVLQQRSARPSLAPDASWGGEAPWTTALNDWGQRLEVLITGNSKRIDRLHEQYDRLDAQHDTTRERVGYLEGRMNGHGTKD